ncbi:MAG: type II secretion system F family protein [Rubrivivax sp.]|nr:type II secretion system F family protein [Rubrivivax sp.]
MRIELVVRSRSAGMMVRSFEAADLAAAQARAAAEGLQVLSAGRSAARAEGAAAHAAPVAAAAAPPRQRGDLDHGALADELSTLLGAGLGVLEAVDALRAGGGSAARRQVLAAVAAALAEGRPLSDAFAATGRFPPLFIAAMRASERTGDLVATLQRHAEHERRMQRLRARVAGAATYPLILLGVGSAVVLFLLGFVVPRFAGLVETTRAEMPLASRWLMQFGKAMSDHPEALVLLLGALVAAAVALVWHVKSGGAERWLPRLPLVGTLTRLYRHSQVYRTAGVLVRGGVPAPQALRQAAPLLPPREREKLLAAVARLGEGQAISQALTEAGLADPVVQRMLVVAERTGTLPQMLERIATRAEARLEAGLDIASRWIEPALMVGIGLVIGAIVVLMYLPIFDLAAQLQ